MERNAGLAMNKEARKLAMKVVREQKNIKEKQRVLSGLKSSDNMKVKNPSILS